MIQNKDYYTEHPLKKRPENDYWNPGIPSKPFSPTRYHEVTEDCYFIWYRAYMSGGQWMPQGFDYYKGQILREKRSKPHTTYVNYNELREKYNGKMDLY